LIKILVIFIALSIPNTLISSVKDTAYIEDLANKITIKPYLTHTFLSFSYILPSSLPREVFKPNTTFDLGLSLSHRWFGIAYSRGITQVGDPKKYGESKYWDIQLDAFVDKSCVEFVFQDYKGFYLSNSSSINTQLKDTITNIIRSDIEILNSSLHYIYLFNGNRLSLRASYSQSERQKKSTGSLIFGASLSYFNIAGDISLLSPIYDKKLIVDPELKYKMGYFVIPSVRMGYAYNFIFKKHFSMLLLATPGVSYGYSYYKLDNDEVRIQKQVNFQAQFRYGLQYNTNSIFIGMDGVSDIYTHTLNTGSFLYNSTRIEFFMGFRIKAPKFVSRVIR
jgi:hypothetical protein